MKCWLLKNYQLLGVNYVAATRTNLKFSEIPRTESSLVTPGTKSASLWTRIHIPTYPLLVVSYRSHINSAIFVVILFAYVCVCVYYVYVENN